jgi:MFS family permease
MTGSLALGGPFWRFWGATSTANLADGVRAAALPLLAAALTSDPLGVALVAAAQQGAALLLGLHAGVTADRYPPARVLVIADWSRVAVLAILLAAVTTGRIGIPLLVGCAFVLGIAETYRDTTAPAALPRLVAKPQLERANGRLVSSEVVGNEFVGPLAGAALFVVAVELPLALDVVAYAVAALLVMSLPSELVGRPPARDEGSRRSLRAEVAGGIGWLWRHRQLRTVVLAGGVLAFADAAWWAVLVLFNREGLGLGDAWYGVLLAAGAVGGLLGALLADRLADRLTPVPLLMVGTLAAGVPAALIVAFPVPVVAAVMLAVSSAGFALWNVVSMTLRQRLVPTEVLGRVMSAFRVMLFGGATLGSVAGGALAAGTTLASPFVLAAGLSVLAAAMLLTVVRQRPHEELPGARVGA